MKTIVFIEIDVFAAEERAASVLRATPLRARRRANIARAVAGERIGTLVSNRFAAAPAAFPSSDQPAGGPAAEPRETT